MRLSNNLIQIPDAMLIDEMMQFIYKASGATNREKAEAARKGEYRKPGESEFGFYDDRVFALMGAYLGHQALANPKSERDIRVERGQVMHERLYPGGRVTAHRVGLRSPEMKLEWIIEDDG